MAAATGGAPDVVIVGGGCNRGVRLITGEPGSGARPVPAAEPGPRARAS
jgi:hypothetical protein